MSSIVLQLVSSNEFDSDKLDELLERSIEENEEFNKITDGHVEVKYSKKIETKKYLIGLELTLNHAEISNLTEIENDNFNPLENIANFNPSPVENSKKILESFIDLISDMEKIFTFKFHDDCLFKKLSKYYQEIFEIEMKLREVLTFMFIDTYKEDYYNLLYDIDLNENDNHFSDDDKEEILANNFENEFFYMSFGTYQKLKSTNKNIEIDKLIPIIDKFDEINSLKYRFENRGIIDIFYKDFLAKIKDNLSNLKKVRNCVAHSRDPTTGEIVNYEKSLRDIKKAINEFWNNCSQKG